MVRAFGLLKRGQRRRVFMLPVEPRKETVGCLGFGGAGAFDAEADVRIGPLGRRDPAGLVRDRPDSVGEISDGHLLHRHDLQRARTHMCPNRPGVVSLNAGSILCSSTASATRRAVNGDRSIPLR